MIGCSVAGGVLLGVLGALFYCSKTQRDKEKVNQTIKSKLSSGMNGRKRKFFFWASPAGSVKLTMTPRDVANERYEPQMVVPIVDMHCIQTEAEMRRTSYVSSVSSKAESIRSNNITSVDSIEEGSGMYSFPSELTDEYQCVQAPGCEPGAWTGPSVSI